MTFELMKRMGLSGFDYSYIFLALVIVSLVLLILVMIQMIFLIRLKKKYKKFMRGSEAKSLEDKIEKILEDNKYLMDLTKENEKAIGDLNRKTEHSFSKVGIIKYDAFDQMGGMLSFSIALLNDHNDGYILNSVHSMEGCYTYVKEIKSGSCDIELSNEEKKALQQAEQQNQDLKL